MHIASLLTLILYLPLVACGFTLTPLERRSRSKTTSKRALEESNLDGAIEPMKIAIDKGFKIGKSISWGVFQKDVDESEIPDKKERESRKEAAAVALVNIDGQERSRRKTAGTVGAVISTILYGVLITAHVGPLTLGGAMYMPVAFSLGFLESGRKGL